MSVRCGYARISTRDQKQDSQYDMLKQAGCQKIFGDTVSGVSEERPEWEKLMEHVRPGDTIVIAELSKMTISLMHLFQLAKEFETKGINLVSLRENIDTSSATGRVFFDIIGAIKQMELELKTERAATGRAAVKARGRAGGRPKTDEKLLRHARILYKNSGSSAAEICNSLGIGRRTFFRYLEKCRQEEYEARLADKSIRIGNKTSEAAR